MKLHVILVKPQIPPNTGNIARLCGATRTPLHLVHPLGFDTDDKTLRRAGLDYWKDVDVNHHDDFAGALRGSGDGPVILFSARSTRPYTEAPYAEGARLVFGARDPKFGGCASLGEVLSDRRLNHQVEIQEGVLADESAELLQTFFRSKRGGSTAR